ncbi:MAG: hypothetical protein NDJ89_15215 [Oligoflexia bacterium]|nr:hypothetical protein [Oligoflexia bacterium]
MRNARIKSFLLIAGAALIPLLALTEVGLMTTRSYLIGLTDQQVPTNTPAKFNGKRDEQGNPILELGGKFQGMTIAAAANEVFPPGEKKPEITGGATGEQQECDQNIDFSDLNAPGSSARVLSPNPTTPVATSPALPSPGREVSKIADEAHGIELIDQGRAARRAVADAALSDYQTLGQSYMNLPLEGFGERMQQAVQGLTDSYETLSAATAGIENAEKMRFRNVVLNARDKAELAAQSIERERRSEQTLEANSPFGQFLKGQLPNPLARTRELAEVFGGKTLTPTQAAGPEGLSNRYVMFAGLPPQQKEQTLSKLKLVELPQLAQRAGGAKTIPLLHNGYYLGGGATSVDCSSFVSSLLPADARKTRYTTLDLMAIWKYRRQGVFPDPPRFEPKRLELLKKAADAFNAVDIYSGERLAVGDLLVYRHSLDPSGHVFMVTAYNPVSMRASVLDASQTAGTIREKELALTADPPGTPERFVRPGLHVLRLKTASNQGCRYKDSAQGAGKKGAGK